MSKLISNITLILAVALSNSFLSQNLNIVFTPEEEEFIKNNPVVEFGYEPSWEPYEIYENGEYKGIVGEYVKIVARETGIEFRPIPNLTWDESLKGLKSGDIKMVPCCAITPDRKKYLEFTEVYVNDPMVIVVRKDYSYVGDLDDLHGKKVALPENYYTSELLAETHPDIEQVLKTDIQSCMEALSFGEVDAFVENLAVVSYYMNNRGFSNLKVSAPTPYKSNGIAWATTKDFVILRDIVQKVISAIPLAEQSDIRQKWISNDYASSFFNRKFVFWSLIYGLIFIVAFGGFYYWNKTLRKQIKLRKESEMKLMDSLVEIKKQDNEKKVLLQEIHHRVKNNLQIVSSMMSLQANVTRDKKSEKTLREAIERIKAIALVHDKIYKSPDVSSVSIDVYLKELVQDVLSNYSMIQKVETEIKCDNLELNLDNVVPLGLIINELTTNSVKYAFHSVGTPKITLILKKNGDGLAGLTYADNGSWIDNPDSDNFGTSLVEIFTEQLDGQYQLFKEPEGTRYLFQFPCECPA